MNERLGVFLQGEADAMSAVIPHHALSVFGFPNAESLAPSFGGRAGVEWYQMNRHLAISFESGLRDAQGFAKRGLVSNDVPLMWDASGGLRYTF